MVDVGAAPIDRYVVLEHLSEGGMGAIYVGKKLGAGGFEMEVVLKQLLPEFTQQEEFIDLFLREAKLSATLDHANIVHTIDLVTAGGEYFIVMEYLPGGDLRTLLKKAKRRGKRFSPSAAIHISREVLSALAYAHVKRDFEGQPLRLIHRDVSPSNILVSRTGEVKLTDFGIAKAATHNSLFYKVKGKIGYMSPEQARSESLDHRSDLYSLAVCMYEVLTGERLFVHAGITTSADEIYSQPVPMVSRKVPGLTPDLDAIMHRALALSPDDRFQTAGEFQEALTRCAHRNGLLVSAPEVARELVDLCGPPEQWRGEDDDDDLGYVHRARTEIYEGGDEEEEEPGMQSIHGLSSRPSSSRVSRPRTEIAKVGGVVELTSIINMIDLEQQHREAMGESRIDVDPGLAPGPPRFDARPALTLPGSAVPPPSAQPYSAQPQRRSGVQPVQRAPGMPPQPVQPMQPMPPAMQPQRRSGMQPVQRAPGMPPQPMPPMQPAMQPMPQQAPADPSDVMPTQPRQQPPMPVPPSPGVLESRWVPHLAAPSRVRSQGKKRSFLQPWMVIVAIILAAAVAGVAIALSGPDVGGQHSK
jgi:serine/threonine protein kinase